MEPIGFDEIFDAVRIEKSREALQELPKDFYQRVARYIEDKQRFLDIKMRQVTSFSEEEIQKEKRQLENVKRLVRDLYSLRERKILALAVYYARTGSELIDKSAMLPEEIEIFNEASNILKKYRTQLLEPILKGKIEEKKEEKEEEKEWTVKILEEIPKFIGPEQVVYGPFSPGDILDLPIDIAKILVNKGKAIRIEQELEEE